MKKINQKGNTTLAVIGAVIVTAVVVGGGIYLWQSVGSQKEKQGLGQGNDFDLARNVAADEKRAGNNKSGSLFQKNDKAVNNSNLGNLGQDNNGIVDRLENNSSQSEETFKLIARKKGYELVSVGGSYD